jgi:hypothetical protein
MKMRWWRGGIAPCILNLGIRWRWVVSSRSVHFTPRVRFPGSHWIGGWVGLRAGLDAVTKKKYHCPCWELNPDRLASSLVSVLTELPWFWSSKRFLAYEDSPNIWYFWTFSWQTEILRYKVTLWLSWSFMRLYIQFHLCLLLDQLLYIGVVNILIKF